jgi:hypothetical protein
MSDLQGWPARQKLPFFTHPGYDYAKIAPELSTGRIVV